MSYSRRKFLISTSIILGGASGGFLFAEANSDTHSAANADEILSAIPGAQSIGKKYLELYPLENDKATLQRLLYPEDLPVIERESHLKQRISEDFQIRETVAINGWILSKTEARLDALAYLIAH